MRPGPGPAFALLAFLAASVPAAAQDFSIVNRLEQAREGTLPALPPGARSLTGREDLVILRQRQFFTLSAGLGLRWTNNAFNAAVDPQWDLITDRQVSLRYENVIAERYTIFAQAAYIGTRYVSFEELGVDAVIGSVGASTAFLGGDISASYDPASIFATGFGTQMVTQHDLSVRFTRAFGLPFGAFAIAGISGHYTPADPADYTSWTARAKLTAVRPFGSFAAIVGIEGSFRSYDDFFPDLFTSRREDTSLLLLGKLRWSPSENVSVSAAVSYTQRWSSIPDFTISVADFSPSMELAIRF